MKIDRLKLGPDCNNPPFCFLTGKCYGAWLLFIDTEMAKGGAVLDAYSHLERLSCGNKECLEQRRQLNYYLHLLPPTKTP